MADQDLLKTPLADLHHELGARMVPFAGYEMPVQYPDGILKEHQHVRAAAGLFDVSHMGQIRLEGGDVDVALESLVPANIVDLKDGRQRYALFTNQEGGIIDDLMVLRQGSDLQLVVNAANKHLDLAHLQAHLPKSVTAVPYFDRALLALQGPAAAAVLARHAPSAADLAFMSGEEICVDGVACVITRSGYTGEDGYEIALDAEEAEGIARKLLAEPEVKPIGLGARDSLRLEAGLCLHGHDIDAKITPVEAALEWAIGKARRSGGARQGGFPGDGIILDQMDNGAAWRRVGLRPEGRAPVREGITLLDKEGRTIGRVTSGGFGASVGGPIAMGVVETGFASNGTEIAAEVRGKTVPLTVAPLPFHPTNYHRPPARKAAS